MTMIPTVLSRSLSRRVVVPLARRRFAGGGGHHGDHHYNGMNMPRPRSMDAELFGGHPKGPEGWETILYTTYGVAIIMFVLISMAPDTSITSWAHDEAQARLDILAKDPDFKFQFGTHYNVKDAMDREASEKLHQASTQSGENDDDGKGDDNGNNE